MLVFASAAVVLSLTIGLLVALNQARIANERLQQVRRLANTFTFRVHDAVRPLPGSLKARQLILETGTQYLDSVATTARGDADLQVELAGAYQRIAEVQGGGFGPNLGNVDQALTTFHKAHQLATAALAKDPNKLKAGAHLPDTLSLAAVGIHRQAGSRASFEFHQRWHQCGRAAPLPIFG